MDGLRMDADATFIARVITEGPLDDVSTHVAWGDDATDPEHALILMRNDDPSPGRSAVLRCLGCGDRVRRRD